ncbi:MAG: porin, partial [Deltaproteobacteria bacterium]|nr:porin [Deltaproteobacteria bacterium]
NAIVTASSEGFSIKSADGNYQLKIRGYIHSDGRFYIDDKGDKFSNQFVLRRVRPIIEGTLSKYFDFRIMPDFGEGKVVLQDAYIDIKPFKAFKIRGGKFKEPVGLERLQSATNLSFIERSLPTHLVPNRDLGIQIYGDAWDGVFSYAVGFFNGIFDGGSTDNDVSDGKDVAGRLFIQPFKKTSIEPLQGLGVGVSGTYGSESGKLSAPSLSSLKTSGQQTFFSYLNDSTAPNTVIADGKRYRLSPQGYFYWGPFGLTGEYVRSTQRVNRNGASKDLTHSAWQVTTSYVLTGDKASFNGVNPKKPINPKKGQWGAVELAGRYSELDVDKATFPTFADPTKSAQKARAWGVGVNWYLSKNFKLQLDYDQTHFKGGDKGGDRPTEKALFTRLQAAF